MALSSLVPRPGYETRFSLHTFFFCALDLISDSSFSSLSIFSVCSCVSWDARAFLASISCPRVISSSSLRRELSLESLVVVSSENFTNCMGRKGGTLVSKETQCFNHPLLGGLCQCQTKWLYGACLGFCVSLWRHDWLHLMFRWITSEGNDYVHILVLFSYKTQDYKLCGWEGGPGYLGNSVAMYTCTCIQRDGQHLKGNNII